MMAPIHSVTRLTGPRALFRLCSPVSPASFSSASIGFVANKGLPMQLLLSGISARFAHYCQFGPEHCSGAAHCTLQENFSDSLTRAVRSDATTGKPAHLIAR